MKKIVIILFIVCFVSGCNPSYNQLKEENFLLKRENKMLKTQVTYGKEEQEKMYLELQNKYDLLLKNKYPKEQVWLDKIEEACYCDCH